MSAETLQHVWDANSIRLIGDGVPAGDLFAAKARLKHGTTGTRSGPVAGITTSSWRGPRWRVDASRAPASCSGRRASLITTPSFCGSMIRRRAMTGSGTRSSSIARRRLCLRFRPSASIVPFEQFTIPGYLRMPPNRTGRVPFAIILGGLESTKEESYRFENMFLARGVATCTFDGPGQGEMYFQAEDAA